MFSTPEDALKQARERVPLETTKGERVTIAVVDDPFTADDETQPYSYCPSGAVALLHPHGTVIATIQLLGKK